MTGGGRKRCRGEAGRDQSAEERSPGPDVAGWLVEASAASMGATPNCSHVRAPGEGRGEVFSAPDASEVTAGRAHGRWPAVLEKIQVSFRWLRGKLKS